MHELGRRKATPEDLPFLVSLRHETMNLHMAASGAISQKRSIFKGSLLISKALRS
jgi:hypothetical protein